MNTTPVRVLVLDDDDTSRYILERYLREWGYEVATAGDAPAALNVLAAGTVDVFVCDIEMPQSVGGAVMARVARIKQPQIKVIFVSAYAFPPDLPTDCPRLKKPIDPQALKTTLRDVTTRVV